jgi:hypothetical protein
MTFGPISVSSTLTVTSKSERPVRAPPNFYYPSSFFSPDPLMAGGCEVC